VPRLLCCINGGDSDGPSERGPKDATTATPHDRDKHAEHADIEGPDTLTATERTSPAVEWLSTNRRRLLDKV